MITAEIEHELRLPWWTICRLAVQARVQNVDFNSLMVEALEDFIERDKCQAALQDYVADHPELTLEQLSDLAYANGMTVRIALERKP